VRERLEPIGHFRSSRLHGPDRRRGVLRLPVYDHDPHNADDDQHDLHVLLRRVLLALGFFRLGRFRLGFFRLGLLRLGLLRLGRLFELRRRQRGQRLVRQRLLGRRVLGRWLVRQRELRLRVLRWRRPQYVSVLPAEPGRLLARAVRAPREARSGWMSPRPGG
jgi:hypothetical protein